MKDAFAAVADQIKNDSAVIVQTTTDAGTDAGDALLEALTQSLSRGKVKDDMAEFRALVAEEAEAIAADDAFQKAADPLLEFEKTHSEVLDRLNEKQQTFADLAQESYAKAARAAYEYAQQEQESMDVAQDAADTAMANLEDRTQKAEELNNMLSDSIVSSISDSTQAFSDMLFGLNDADASAVLGALLQPFANMAKQLGEMLIVEGMGIEAFKESMKSLNPAVSIAAGAALIALSAALSSGIQALGRSGGTSAMSSSTGSSASTSTTNENISTEMTVYVKGKISGKDILISGDNARNYYGR